MKVIVKSLSATAWRRLALFVLLLCSLLLFAGCVNRVNANRAWAVPDRVPTGDPQRGEEAIVRYGCGACHEIAGVPGAQGQVGPPLTSIRQRAFVAGMVPNTPDGLALWIREPQSIVPGNAMPNLDVSEADAQDIVAYLYALR